MHLPILKGRHIKLTPFTPDHISDEYLSWLNDKELMRFSRQRFHTHTRETSIDYLNSFEGSPHYFFAIEQIENNLHIGTLNVFCDMENATADIGLLIGHRDAVGKGYGKSAWNLAINYLLNTIHVRKITGGTSAKNTAMIRIMETSGMQPEGRRIQQELIEGEPTDVLYFGKLNPLWKPST